VETSYPRDERDTLALAVQGVRAGLWTGRELLYVGCAFAVLAAGIMVAVITTGAWRLLGGSAAPIIVALVARAIDRIAGRTEAAMEEGDPARAALEALDDTRREQIAIRRSMIDPPFRP
jgi:hypothetical protein